MALERQSRGAEGARILGCLQHNLEATVGDALPLARRSAGRTRDVAGEPACAARRPPGVRWLDKAVARGWLGQYYSANLADWPQFDRLRGDPRYAAMQRRIDFQNCEKNAPKRLR